MRAKFFLYDKMITLLIADLKIGLKHKIIHFAKDFHLKSSISEMKCRRGVQVYTPFFIGNLGQESVLKVFIFL